MSNVIFEIFSEELPATLQKKIAIDYKQFAEKELKELKVEIKSENVFVGITLNRLVLKLENVEITEQQLKDFIDKTLKDFSKTFPRTMCYPQLEVRWLRPIRGLFACIDNQVLSGNFYGLELKNGTYINKFDFVKCGGFDDYVKILTKEQIEVDYSKRLEFVKRAIHDFDKKIMNSIYKNIKNPTFNNYDYYWKFFANNKNKLAEEIAGMSEYCTEPMVSTLDTRFNVLPFELIELVLRENQRYVVFRPNDKKEIKFLIFGEKITANKTKRDNIVKGHRKVVNARLDDALYYWQLDKKEQEKCGGLDKYKAHLKEVLSSRTFIDDITWGDYLKKQEEFAEKIIENKGILDKTKQLILETKLDLATGVVAEFPELQGLIGGYYFDYQFNPYALDKNSIQSLKQEILYYYLIDRMSYIQTMYQQGKQPTGSGDKYKVKARMDDIVELYVNGFLKTRLNWSNTLQNCINIDNLFCKRFQKYIEDKYNNVKNIKKFAEISTNIKWFNLDIAIRLFSNEKFVKTFKRINGYTKKVEFVDNQNVENKAQEIFKNEYIPTIYEFLNNNIFKNEDISTIDEFLNNNKIEGDDLAKQALKYIEVKYFEPNLPVEFLEIV